MFIKRSFYYTLLLLLAVTAYGRQQQQPLQSALQAAIQKAYNASVRAWGYDTARKTQNSAQFSAVVVSSDGYLLTVAHAIQPGRTYKVSFPDGKEALALGLGRIDLASSRTMPDVAMMKIIGNGHWPFAAMGISGALREGDPCFSIGYPEALARSLPGIRFGYIITPQMPSGFILSSCAMEVGDSGGPLFDLQGRVIGLNSRCDTTEDKNYHVPVDLYRKYFTALSRPENYTEYPAVTDSLVNTDQAAAMAYIPPASRVPVASGASVVVQSMLAGKPQIIAGTALAGNAGGTYIISKSSCVAEVPVVIAGNKPLKAQVIARSKAHDLVLLYIAGKIKGALQPADTSYPVHTPAPGEFVYAVLPDGTQRQGIKGSNTFSLPAKFSSGYFGANATWMDGAATLSRIQPNSPVIATGLKEKDQVLSIAGQPVNKPEDYGAILLQFFPGDTISLQVKRGDSLFQQQVILPPRPERKSSHVADLFAGGKSGRRDGFPNVWHCDARITAADAGTPVYDANGKFCGIAIARFSRTAALVIPATVINQWIKQHIK